MIYWRYLLAVLRHKWFVFLTASELGIPWLGVIHDLSKFRPSEFIPYARRFYGTLDKDSDEIMFAFYLHYKRNKHHWQYWLSNLYYGKTMAFPMPLRYAKEMLADWIGAGRAYGKQAQNNNNPDTRAWYLDNREKIVLHPATRAWIEEQLNVTNP